LKKLLDGQKYLFVSVLIIIELNKMGNVSLANSSLNVFLLFVFI